MANVSAPAPSAGSSRNTSASSVNAIANANADPSSDGDATSFSQLVGAQPSPQPQAKTSGSGSQPVSAQGNAAASAAQRTAEQSAPKASDVQPAPDAAKSADAPSSQDVAPSSDASQAQVATTVSGLQATLTKLVASGVSLQQIAQTIADSLAQHQGLTGEAATAYAARIVQQLAPAGQGPPANPATAVAQLLDKLTTLLADLDAANDASTSTKDDESGQILDARKAKETSSSATGSDNQATSGAAALLSFFGLTPQAFDPQQSASASSNVQAVADGSGAQQTQAQFFLNHWTSGGSGSNTALPAKSSDAVAATSVSTATNVPAATVQNTAAANAIAQQTASRLGTSAASQVALSGAAGGAMTAAVTPTPAVSTKLGAVASGGNTDALGRALIRAANSGANTVVAATVTGPAIKSMLDDISKALGALLADRQDAGSTTSPPAPNAGVRALDAASFDTSLPAALAQQTGTGTANPAAASGSDVASFGTHLSSQSQGAAPSDLMDQVVSGLSVRDLASNPTVRIALTPAHLGEITVKLTVTDSTVNASVVTASADVRSALLANSGQLDRTLAQAGLKLGTLTVDVSSQNGGQEQQRQRESQQTGLTFSRNGKTSDDDVESVASAGPSMLGSVDLGLLNQLV